MRNLKYAFWTILAQLEKGEYESERNKSVNKSSNCVRCRMQVGLNRYMEHEIDRRERDPSFRSSTPGRFFVPSLVIANIAVFVSNTIVTLLLLEMASTFQVNEGVAIQLRTFNSFAEVAFGLLLGVLTYRFKHKSLLLIGTIAVAVSAVGTFFAPTIDLMMLFAFVEGSGSIMVIVTSLAIVGDFQLPKKTQAIGWITSANSIFLFLGTPIVNSVADIGGWRLAFLLTVLPFSFVGFLLAFFSIPSSHSKLQPYSRNKNAYTDTLRQVFLSKTGAVCLIGGLLFPGTSLGILALAFYRLHFLLPREYTVYILLFVGGVGVLSSLVTGRFGYKFSSRLLTVIALLGYSVCVFFLFFSPYLWLTLVLNLLFVAFSFMALTAFNCLVLEQIPNSRCTMVCFYRVFTSVGSIVAPAVGGSLLVLFSNSVDTGYQAVGVAFSIMSVLAAGILSIAKVKIKDLELRA